MNQCEVCKFNNPKGTTTGIVIKRNQVLLLKRNIEPYRGYYDFVGGYMEQGELPEETIRREIKEELGVDATEITLIKQWPGEGEYNGMKYPVLEHFFLVDLNAADIQLNHENLNQMWITIDELSEEYVVWKAHKEFIKWLKDNFQFNLPEVETLIKQLDPAAELNEQSLYKAIINGHIEKAYNGPELIGMGWIYPRTTLLRKQAVIEDMCVLEAYRGKGIGRKILRGLIKWATENGIETIELTTGHHRKAAGELYLSEGFKLHDTRHMLLKL